MDFVNQEKVTRPMTVFAVHEIRSIIYKDTGKNSQRQPTKKKNFQ